MNIGGGNPKLSSNLKHSKASLKKLYKSRLTYKKSWEEKYFLYVLISIGENPRGGNSAQGGGKSQGSPPPSVSNPDVHHSRMFRKRMCQVNTHSTCLLLQAK